MQKNFNISLPTLLIAFMCSFNQSLFAIELHVSHLTCPGADDGEIEAEVTGGTYPYHFQWSNGVEGEGVHIIKDLAVGTYGLTVTDADGCVVMDEAEVTDDGYEITMSVEVVSDIDLCWSGIPLPITLKADPVGGFPPYSYTWKQVTLQGEIIIGTTNPHLLEISKTETFFMHMIDDRSCEVEGSVTAIVVPTGCSFDPNIITGPLGFGPERWVSIEDRLDYSIEFENDPDFATAPAQKVKVTHKFHENMDMASFRLGDFGFGYHAFTVPPNSLYYSQRLDVRYNLGIYVDVTAGLDVTRNEAFWIFESIDPQTGLPPTDPFTGLLPVNDTTYQGIGFANFSIKPIATANTGDSIIAEADIVFDINAPIRTSPYVNLIDALPPASQMDSIPAVVGVNTFMLTWEGQDDPGGTGVRSYDVYVSTDNNIFHLLQSSVYDTMILFTGQYGSTYSFFSIAVDNVGNREATKPVGDITVSIESPDFLLLPDSTSVVCIGDSLTASWISPTGLSYLNLALSADNGNSFYDIAVGVTASDSIYQWLVPDSLSGGTSYLIKATNTFTGQTLDVSDPFTILPRPQLNLGNDTSICAGSSVQLDAGSGFTSYLWSDNSTGQYLSVSDSGWYAVSITDSDGCTNTDSVHVTINDLPVLAVQATDASCFGGNDGSADLSASGGTAPYTYSWSTGSTDEDIAALSVGTYQVTVIDSLGCQKDTVIAISEPTLLSASAGLLIVQCPDDTSRIDLSVSGGTAPYTYNWSTGETIEDIKVVAAGTYDVTVTDANGCTAFASITVNPASNPPPVNDVKLCAITLNDIDDWCSPLAAYTNENATADGTKGSCWPGGPNYDVWFTFQATTSEIAIELKTDGVEGSLQFPNMALWDGQGNELACIEFIDATMDIKMQAQGLTVGNDYFITVDNAWGSLSRGTFSLCIDDELDYDFKSAAIEVTNTSNWCSANAAYTTFNATADEQKGSCWGTGPNYNRWFKFQATTTRIEVDMKTDGSEGTLRYPYLALWDAAGNEVACKKHTGTYDDIQMIATGLTEGAWYYISADNYSLFPAYRGTFTLCVNAVEDDDYKDDAHELTDVDNWCSANAEFTTIDATADEQKGSCWANGPNYNRWFSFEAVTSDVTIDVKTNGSEGTLRYAYLALWDGAGNELGCAKANWPNNDISVNHSGLTVGNTYYISVDNRILGAYKGTFTLCVDNGTGGSSKSSISESNEDKLEDNWVSVFPNPTAGLVNLKFVKAIKKQSITIEVVDTYGKLLIENQIVANSEVSIDLDGLPSGVYFITIYADEGIITKKIFRY